MLSYHGANGPESSKMICLEEGGSTSWMSRQPQCLVEFIRMRHWRQSLQSTVDMSKVLISLISWEGLHRVTSVCHQRRQQPDDSSQEMHQTLTVVVLETSVQDQAASASFLVGHQILALVCNQQCCQNLLLFKVHTSPKPRFFHHNWRFWGSFYMLKKVVFQRIKNQVW